MIVAIVILFLCVAILGIVVVVLAHEGMRLKKLTDIMVVAAEVNARRSLVFQDYLNITDDEMNRWFVARADRHRWQGPGGASGTGGETLQ